MKPKIHPEYFEKAKVTCACGNSFHVGATKKEVAVEICSKCHPFFTGEEKLLDVAGRVERFKSRKAKIVAKAPKKPKAKKGK